MSKECLHNYRFAAYVLVRIPGGGPAVQSEATKRGDIAMLLNMFCMLDVVCCTPRTTVLEAAHLMRQRHVGDLVVVEDDEAEKDPLGVITDRDIVVDVLAKGLDPATTLVASVMRSPVVIAHEDEDSSMTLERMRTHGVRRISVPSDRRPSRRSAPPRPSRG